MPRALSPSQFLVLSFAVLILLGSIVLWLPVSSEPGQHLSFLDALFTSTSAVCVTGLIVVDTPNAFSTFGEVVVMLLIFVGGLGYMTLSAVPPWARSSRCRSGRRCRRRSTSIPATELRGSPRPSSGWP